MLKQNGTRLLSSGAPGQTATIIAGQNLFAYMLITPPYPVNDVEISYITFDGRGDVPGWRLNRYCTPPYQTPGNIAIWGDRTYIHDSESKQALCGSGLQILGSNYTVNNNYIAYNGRDRLSGEPGAPWSDGITALSCFGGTISNNTVVDNTDVNIVTGGGNCNIHDNHIIQGGRYAFAGIQVGWFQEGGGNHAGATIMNNVIETGVANRLGMGLLVGFHPWNPNVDISGGDIEFNSISGAVIDLAIEGAYGITVQSNSWNGHNIGYAGPSDSPSCYIKGIDFTAYHYSGEVQNGSVAFQFDKDTCAIH